MKYYSLWYNSLYIFVTLGAVVRAEKRKKQMNFKHLYQRSGNSMDNRNTSNKTKYIHIYTNKYCIKLKYQLHIIRQTVF